MKQTNKLKILILDDEESILSSLKRLFRENYEVLTASNPIAALNILEDHPDCSLVLSDFQMPNGNGLHFLNQVKIKYPQAARCILSGQMDLPELSKAINETEIHRFILKPWDNDYLTIQISEAIQLHNLIKEKDRLLSLAITDPITGLTNHRFFQEKLAKSLPQNNSAISNLSLLMIDVDYFKSYNDHYGHQEGDRLLYLISDRLKSIVGENGHVSRYGGEEFAVILPSCNHEAAQDLAENLRIAFEKSPFIGPNGRPAYITVSVGVANACQKSDTSESLLRSADKALYQAKRQGRNRVVSSPSNSK